MTVRAYVLIETTPERTGAVHAAVGHGLANCLALGHSFQTSEVLAHLECTDLTYLHEAISREYTGRDGVIRVTPSRSSTGSSVERPLRRSIPVEPQRDESRPMGS